MKAYSIDFRQKIIDAYENEGVSQRGLASRFRVSLSFIQELLKRYRTTGSIAPKIRTEQTPTKLNQKQLEELAELVQEHNDATLEELCDLLKEKVGVRISRSTMERMLKKLNYTRKKNAVPRGESE